VGDRGGEATTLNNIGGIYSDLGEMQKALQFLNQALPLYRAVGDRGGEAPTLVGIGLVYSDLGEKQKALEFYNQALPLRRAVGDRGGKAITLDNMGGVYSDLGEKQKALQFLNQALPILKAVGDRGGEATTLNNIGSVYDSLGEKQKALEFYNQALPILKAVGYGRMEATTLNNIGIVYSDLGENQKALQFYNQALPLRRAVGDKGGEANTLRNIAYLQRSQGKLNEALTKIESAINIIEELRTKITSQNLRASYFATVQGYYKLYIDLLMELHKQQPSKGYDAQALEASERSRARVLLELLTEANADIRTGVDSQLLNQERNLQQQLNALEHRKYQLLNGQYSQKQLTEINQNIESILTQVDQLEVKIRTTSPRYADLKYPQPLTLKEIQQQVLDDNTLLLQYSLGKDRSYLWAVSKNNITSYELSKNADIETIAKQFESFLQSPTLGDTKPGEKLSEILLKPVADKLANKRLLIVGDGILQYIPFAALPVPEQTTQYTPLLTKNEIITLPSASTISILRRQTNNRKLASKKVAVIADPVFQANDIRFSDSPQPEPPKKLSENLTRSIFQVGTELNRLEYTRVEAEKIVKLVDKTKTIEALDFQANKDVVTSPQLANYQIVHFATHGLLNSQNPELSGLVFSLFDKNGKEQDGFLRLNDIFNLDLPAELVVLSACQTGLGEEVKGEGLVGLTRGFMYAGAKRVVVSLWSVNDVGTSELMTRFYQKMLKQNLKPAQAMREAQLEMMKTQWSAPYYWGAFTVQGDWN
jgi:CHAT domain-containing protein/Tfp pilus assembly protein PilF